MDIVIVIKCSDAVKYVCVVYLMSSFTESNINRLTANLL